MENRCVRRGWISFAVLRGITACAVAGSGMFAFAQERIPTEETQKIARKLIETLGKPADVQLTVDADPDQSEGYKHDQLGLVVLPDRKLTAEALNAAGAEPIPVGQLWLKGISPMVDGKVIPNGQHRVFSLTVKDNTFDVAVCLLGARKRDGKLELVLFGTGKTPILVAVLEPDQSVATAAISIAVQKENDDTGRVDLSLVGKYKAKLLMKKAE